MYGYIYKTTNLLNGKIYVGQRKSKEFIKSYYGSGTLIKKSIEKYGKENFSVELIDFAMSADELDEKEIWYIEKLKSKHTYGNYNLADGGFLARYDFNNQPEWKKEEIRKKLSLVNKGRKRTEETRKRISDVQKGRKQSKETRIKKSISTKESLKNDKERLAKHVDTLNKHRCNRSQAIDVYDGVDLVYSFKSYKECWNYFSKLGLGRNPLTKNLLKGQSICPSERPSNMSRKTYDARVRFKHYRFIYRERG